MKEILLLFAILLGIGIININAQQAQIDSLTKLLSQTKDDSSSARIYDELAWMHIYDKPEKAREYAFASLKLFQKIKDSRGVGISNITVGNTYLIVQNYDSASHHYYTAIDVFQKLDAWKDIGTCYNNLAIIAGNKGLLDEAEAMHEKGLKYRTMAKDTTTMIESMINLGTIWLNDNREDEALELSLNAIRLAEKTKQLLPQAILQANVGAIYLNRRDIQLARQYIMPARHFFESTNNVYRLIAIYNNIGQILIQENQIDSAVYYFNKSLAINDFDEYGKAYSLHYLADAYAKNKEPQTALSHYRSALKLEQELEMNMEMTASQVAIGSILNETGKYQQAITILQQVLLASDTIEGTWKEQAEANKTLLASHLRIQNEPHLIHLLNDYARLRDTIYSKEKSKVIANTEAQYQNEKKEAENELLRQKSALQNARLQRQQIILIAALLVALLLGLVSFLIYRRSQYRKRTNQLLSDKNEKIELLHRELSHRVKNNLAFVSSLMRMQARRLESKEAKQAVKEGEARIEAMSLLHRKLYLQENATVETSTYIKELCSYLQHSFPSDTKAPTIEVDIQQLKMNGEDAMRLGLIINELVTNSFKYAFTDQEEPMISIQLSTGTNGAYHLLYKDNGKGLPSELEMEQNNSLGLKLIHTLTRQLNGQIKQYNDGGACFQIAFEESKIAV